jgi:hypothetical protein
MDTSITTRIVADIRQTVPKKIEITEIGGKCCWGKRKANKRTNE